MRRISICPLSKPGLAGAGGRRWSEHDQERENAHSHC